MKTSPVLLLCFRVRKDLTSTMKIMDAVFVQRLCLAPTKNSTDVQNMYDNCVSYCITVYTLLLILRINIEGKSYVVEVSVVVGSAGVVLSNAGSQMLPLVLRFPA